MDDLDRVMGRMKPTLTEAEKRAVLERVLRENRFSLADALIVQNFLIDRKNVAVFGPEAFAQLEAIQKAWYEEQERLSMLRKFPPPFPDEAAEWIAFIRSKVEHIVEHSWKAEFEEDVRSEWEPKLAGLDASVITKRQARELDDSLDQLMARVVLEEDWHLVRASLRKEFYISGLGAKELRKLKVPGRSDWIVLRPRTEMPEKVVIDGKEKINLSGFDLYEIAQLYADFSRWELRMTTEVRNLSLGELGDMRYMDPWPTRAIAHLDWILKNAGLKIVRKRRGILLLQRAALTRGEQQARATKSASVNISAALDDEQFWRIIDDARSQSSEPRNIAEYLKARILRLERRQILAFEFRLEQRLAESYRWDLWGVAYIVNGDCSNDGFEYFRGWLVAQGRKYFEAALRDPERAADRASTGFKRNQCEEMLYVASEPYRRRFQEEIPAGLVESPAEPAGSRWRVEELPERFPGLVARFYGPDRAG